MQHLLTEVTLLKTKEPILSSWLASGTSHFYLAPLLRCLAQNQNTEENQGQSRWELPSLYNAGSQLRGRCKTSTLQLQKAMMGARLQIKLNAEQRAHAHTHTEEKKTKILLW